MTEKEIEELTKFVLSFITDEVEIVCMGDTEAEEMLKDAVKDGIEVYFKCFKDKEEV